MTKDWRLLSSLNGQAAARPGVSAQNPKLVPKSAKHPCNSISGSRRGSTAQRCCRLPQSRSRAEVGQYTDSIGAAAIHRQLMIVASTCSDVRTRSGWLQGVTVDHRLHQVTRAPPEHHDGHCQGTNPPSRRPNHGASGIQQRRRSNQETPRYRIGHQRTPIAPRARAELSLAGVQVRRTRASTAQKRAATAQL